MQSRVIASTKLAIPKPLRALVPRPALVARLDDPTYRLGVVSAPAGYGKTALLATWADGWRDRTTWLSCDVTDTEPTRFWTGLLTALAGQWPGVGDDAAIVLERLGFDSHDVAISVANDLAEVASPVVIVIDDLHLAKPAPDVLSEFVVALPSNVRLVIGSRLDPPFSLARMRVAGSLLELHSDELRFTEVETAALLAANDVTVTAAELQWLQDLTEGWPAVVQLAALSLQKVNDRSRFLDAFASTDRAVTDFLVNEVLNTQPADRVEFLYRTCVFDQFDVELCEQVTERDDAGALLHQLVAANLFVVPLDDAGEWYRYHHLFAAFLRARLRAQGSARVHDAHDRAGRALEARGDVLGALQHATAIGDLDRAATIVRGSMGRWMNLIDVETTAAAARHWLHLHGNELVATDPESVLEFVLALIVSSGPDDALRWLTRIEQAHPDASPELTAYLHGVWSEHHLHRGQVDEGLRHAQIAFEAVRGAPPDRRLYPMLSTVHARAHIESGDAAGARTALDAAIERSVGHPALDDVRLPGMRAWVAYLQGDLSRAEHWAQGAVRRADELDLAAHEPGRLFAGLVLACLLSERMDDVAAERLLEEVRDAADLNPRPSLQSLVTLQQAQLARLTGDETSAETHLTRARLLLPDASSSVRAIFLAEETRQALQFRPSSAAELAAELDASPAAIVLRAHVAFHHDDQRAASALLASLPAAATTRERVEHGVLSALIERDVESANGHLAAALTTARPERFMRTIIGQGPAVSKLLSSFTPGRVLQDYVEELIDAVSAVVAPARPPVVTSLVEALSAREITVLRYLSSRLTNQEIASALYVSLNTLKSHVKSIYRKLAVSSRREAVEVGRQLRLI